MIPIKVYFNLGTPNEIEYTPGNYLQISLPYVPRIRESVLISETVIEKFHNKLQEKPKVLREYFPKWFLNCSTNTDFSEEVFDQFYLHEAVIVVDVIYVENKDEISIILDKEGIK